MANPLNLSSKAYTPGVRVLAASMTALIFLAGAAWADTVGYWRMETDNSTGTGVSVPDEMGNSPLTISSGDLDSGQSDSVMTNLLANGLSNTASLNGSAEINATVASYTALNTTNITIEFFARTAEGLAGFFTRSEGSTGQAFGTNGVCILDPDAMDVQYCIDDGEGGLTNMTWNDFYDTTGDWEHFAFTYDATNGIGTFYVNGVTWIRYDGPDNRPLMWGAGNTAILVGNGMDGGGTLATSDQGLFDELCICDTALAPDQLLYRSPLIARDSFAVRGMPGDYVEARLRLQATNEIAVSGTVGFSVTNGWAGSDTSNTDTLNDSPDGSPLGHSLLSGEILGALRIKAKDSRDQYRRLSVTVPDSDVYYMCALLHAQNSESNENLSIGFSDAAGNRSKGIHIGFNDKHIAVFAGDTAYNLSRYEYALNTTYLVVVKLTADPSGLDTIEAYWAKDGDTTIDRKVCAEVETFSSPSDLQYLKIRIVGNLVSDNRTWWADEARLATSAAALGIDPALLRIPPLEGTMLLYR